MKNKQKKKIICLDFDGVIANSGERKRAVASALIGRRISLGEASGERVRAGKSPLTEGDWDLVKHKTYFEKGAIDHLKPVAHSISAIRRWLRDGHTVKVVTARTEGARTDAIRWLKRHGLSIPVIGAGARTTKVPYLIGADIFVDDDADRVAEARAVVPRVYLFRWPYNDPLKEVRGITSLKRIRISAA